MTTGTINIITRLKQHMNDTQDEIRRAKAWTRTPWDQRPPASGPTLDQLKELATALCITRAVMRGKIHWKKGDQMEWLNTKLKNAEAWETSWKKPHPTLPSWMRNTIKAALEAAKLEPARREERQKRWKEYQAKRAPAA